MVFHGRYRQLRKICIFCHDPRATTLHGVRMCYSEGSELGRDTKSLRCDTTQRGKLGRSHKCDDRVRPSRTAWKQAPRTVRFVELTIGMYSLDKLHPEESLHPLTAFFLFFPLDFAQPRRNSLFTTRPTQLVQWHRARSLKRAILIIDAATCDFADGSGQSFKQP